MKNVIDDLDIQCETDGETLVRVNVHLDSIEDIDDLIAWLKLAKHVMHMWMRIRSESLEFRMQNDELRAQNNELRARK